MTAIEEQALKLPKSQKISLMEALWADLTSGIELIDPPTWHLAELEATEKRVAEGKEHFEDWDDAKRRLREE